MICKNCGKNKSESEDDVEWITVNGNHIPVKQGQSKDDAIKDFIDKKGLHSTDFKSYDDAKKYIDRKLTQYGSKQAMTSSPEYRDAYPKIMAIRAKDMSANAIQPMKDVNVKFGDKVSYHAVGSFGNVDIKSGTVISKDGIPYVKLDGSRKTVLWHKGFRK